MRKVVLLIILILILSLSACSLSFGDSSSDTSLEETTLDATTPKATTPNETIPEVTTPIEETPQITTPSETTPEITTPNINPTEKEYINELFGDDITIYTNEEENPYNIDLNQYGSNVRAYFYTPKINVMLDPYETVESEEFYTDYKSATSYEDAYFRTKHYLMSGDISLQDHIPNSEVLYQEDVAIRLTNATYILSTTGEYLAYIPNVLNGDDYIIFYNAGYTSLNEVAAYLLAFGETPANQHNKKSSTAKKEIISMWGEYGRVNDATFSGDISKYPYEPELPNILGINSITYNEMDFGTKGGYVNENSLGTYYEQGLYNDGYTIDRGAARFVYVSDMSVKSIDERHVFYTYNHYNDFQEYLNYHNGFGIRFGNESAGNEYCGNSNDFESLSCKEPTQYPLVIFKSYLEL